MRRPLVAGNWKMHGTLESITHLLDGLREQALPDTVDIAVFPVFLHMYKAQQILQDTPIQWGAQDCATQLEEGAMTGDVSPLQLRDLGCSMVLVGHSERRQLHNENEQVVRHKFIAAQAAGLKPVLCVGETRQEREQGLAVDIVTTQIDAIIGAVGVQALAQAVLAYEPVWAIGTGLTATPEQAQEVHASIRQYVAGYDARVASKLRILYGGSVKGNNAVELFAQADIDGGLVGGASLNAEEFGAICRAAGK